MVLTRCARWVLAPLFSLSLWAALTVGWLATPAHATGPDCASMYAGAYALGAAYTDSTVTIPACGPRPMYDANARTAVYPYPGAFWVNGFQCMEIAERYMYYKYGLTMPQSTNGDQVVDHYAARYPSKFTIIPNGSAGLAPRQGDVVSMSNDPGFSAANGGHVSIVQSSSVNSSGNGTVTIVEQNSSTTGWNTYYVTGWVVKTGFTYTKWLRAGQVSVGSVVSAVPSTMAAGASISSPTGSTRLVMQNDGNLVSYNRTGTALWATGTHVPGSVFKVQGDGNAVLYDPNGFPIWASNTYGSNKLLVQDDGNVVMYNGGTAVWDSRGYTRHPGIYFTLRQQFSTLTSGQSVTSRNGAYKLVMQADGNLVEQLSSGAVVWSSQTSVAGSRVTAQSDGNTVIYTPTGQALWATNTMGGNNHLVIQDDGNIVVYSASGLPLWDAGGFTGHPAIRF